VHLGTYFVGNVIDLTDDCSSPIGPIETYEWEVWDGTSSESITSSTYTPPDSGSYTFTLTCTDIKGLKVQSQSAINVLESPGLTAYINDPVLNGVEAGGGEFFPTEVSFSASDTFAVLVFGNTGLYSGNTAQTWQETHRDIKFVDGYIQITIGEINPLSGDILSIPTANFRIIIEGEEVEVPLFSVPYALKAHVADNLPDVIDISQATITTINAKSILIDGSPVKTQISNSDVTTNAAIAFTKLNITKADIVGLGIPAVDTNTNTTTTNAEYLRQRAVSSSAPSDTQVLKWNATLSNWEPSSDVGTTVTETEVDAFVADNGYLVSANNLSDVVSVSLARTNLALGTSDSPQFTGLSLTSGLSGVSALYTGTVTASAFVGDASGLTGITAGALSDGSVSGSKIADGSITSSDMATSAVTTEKIADSANNSSCSIPLSWS